MTLLVLPYPEIDPVLVQLGPFAIRWYALAYIAGLVLGWQIMRRVCTQPPKVLSPEKIDDFLLWAALGVILGGRLGYVLFYKPGFYLSHPMSILTVWEGGMSFHGGMLGVIVAVIAFARRNKAPIFMLADLAALVAPIGLFFGRLANFINGELWGKPTDLPWAFGVPTPSGVLIGRHPSQLYGASLEGLVLFAVVWWFTSKPRPRLAPTGLFLFVYGCARFIVEWVRLPDANIGYLVGDWLTMGMLLTTPMIFIGAGLMIYAYRRNAATGNLGAVKA